MSLLKFVYSTNDIRVVKNNVIISSVYNNKNKNDKKVYIFMVFESLDFLYVPSLNIKDSI